MEMNSEEFLISNNSWVLKSTEHFKFYFDKSIDENFQQKIIIEQELNYKEISNLMALDEQNISKINFWLFKDKDQKKKLSLVGSDAHAISTFPSVYYLPKNATGAQEIGHVLTQINWGFIPKTSNYALIIDEGFNYYIDSERFYKEKIIDKLRALDSNKEVNITKIIEANNGKRIKGVLTGSHEVNESIVSGAFVEFMINNYGIYKFSKLWKKAVESETADSTIFKEIYGKNAEELNNEFISLLNQ